MSNPPSNPLIPATHSPHTAGCRIVVGLFALAAMIIAALWVHPSFKDSAWLDAVALGLALAAALASLAAQLPLVNVLMAAGLAAAIGGVAHAINSVTGLPFGRMDFQPAAGLSLLGILPWAAPVWWAALALTTRGLARLLLHQRREHPLHGLRVIALAVLFTLVSAFPLHGLGAEVKGWWTETPSVILRLAGWTVTALAVQVAITALLIDKFPGNKPRNLLPLVVWLGLHTPMTADLLAHRHWLAAGVAVGGILLAVLPTLRPRR